MTPRLTTNCVKNYCNRTLIVKVTVENVVTRFLLGHGVETWFQMIGNGLSRVQRSRDRLRHVTQKGQGHDPVRAGAHYLENGWR